MDELKMLVEMVANMPTLAVWVLVGFLAYKVAVVGSIYGLARFLIEKLHDWAVKKKAAILSTKDLAVIDEDAAAQLRVQLKRIRQANMNYIHSSDVDRLRQAIDKMEAEAKK